MNSIQHLVAPAACMATGITFFLGFMPIAKVSPRFFALHSLIAGILLGSAVLGSCYLLLMEGSSFKRDKSIPSDVLQRSLHLFPAPWLSAPPCLSRSPWPSGLKRMLPACGSSGSISPKWPPW